MTFQDIFKSSFLENIATISILDMVIAMVLAFLLEYRHHLHTGHGDCHGIGLSAGIVYLFHL